MRRFYFFKKNWAVLSCFFVLIFIIYGQSLSGNFVFDDRNITENIGTLSHPQDLGEVILHPYWSKESGLYRPVTLISYTLIFAIFGNNKDSFHFINLALHVFVCSLIYLLEKKLFKKDSLAFITALLFLLLPIHTEVVANISGRGELLALLFSLLAFIECAKGKTNFWLAGIWAFLAIGSKETASAVLPLAFMVLYIKDSSQISETGKKIAQERTYYMHEFIKRLDKEIGGKL